MPKQVEVLVRDISTDEHGHPTELSGTTRVLTYKSFNYLNSNQNNLRYELIGEVASVDSEGNVTLAPGNPNLNAQHRQALQQSANLAASSGPSVAEIEMQKEIAKLRAELTQKQALENVPHETPEVKPEVQEPPKERKKPGPKKKILTETEFVA